MSVRCIVCTSQLSLSDLDALRIYGLLPRRLRALRLGSLVKAKGFYGLLLALPFLRRHFNGCRGSRR